jgi:hypothetical protein
MVAIYSADPSLQTAIGSALSFYGLDPSPTAATRRPVPARTLAEQMQRIALGSKVLALVRRSVPVGEDDRRLIYRLVDSGCERLEQADHADPPARKSVNDAAVIAYAVAGGGAVGTFENFCRTFTSSAEVLEPAVDRQDVKPAPLHDPRRRPNPPGSAAPAKTNPTRTIRSSRWVAGGKAVRS